MLNSGDGERIKKTLTLDVKTWRGNGRAGQKANRIVSAADENGFCPGEKCVGETSNEIKAIPELLDSLNVKNNFITTGAMGCRT